MRQPNALPQIAREVALSALAGAHYDRDAYEAAAYEYVRDSLGRLAMWLRDHRTTSQRHACALAHSAHALATAPNVTPSDALRHTAFVARAIMDVCEGRLDAAQRYVANAYDYANAA